MATVALAGIEIMRSESFIRCSSFLSKNVYKTRSKGISPVDHNETHGQHGRDPPRRMRLTGKMPVLREAGGPVRVGAGRPL
jgi:hypothetical protein